MEIPEILLVVVLSDIRTRGSIQKWPWKGCKEKLVKAGYFVQFAPNAKSQESDIMQPSNQLTPTQARDILSDLLENKILMLETEEGPSRKAKRKRNLESSPPPLHLRLNTNPVSPSPNTAPIVNETPTDVASTDDMTIAHDTEQ